MRRMGWGRVHGKREEEEVAEERRNKVSSARRDDIKREAKARAHLNQPLQEPRLRLHRLRIKALPTQKVQSPHQHTLKVLMALKLPRA